MQNFTFFGILLNWFSFVTVGWRDFCTKWWRIRWRFSGRTNGRWWWWRWKWWSKLTVILDLLKVVILSFLNEYVCNRNHIYLLLCSLQKLGANRCIFLYFSEIMKVHFSRRARIVFFFENEQPSTNIILKMSSADVTKYAVSCGFGHINWINP